MNFKEINERLAAINTELRSAKTTEEIENLQQEAQDLLEKRGAALALMQRDAQDAINLRVANQNVEQPKGNIDYEERAKALIAKRSIKLDSNLNIVHNDVNVTDRIVPGFNVVSNIINAVKYVNMDGAESYTVMYDKDPGTGAYVAEAAAATATDASTGVATVSKAKIVAYTEVTEEIEKLAPKIFVDQIQNKLSVALRRKLAQEITNGDGEANHLVGIFSNQAKAIETTSDIEFSALDEDTIDTLMYAYGGTEDFTFGFFTMNKKTLGELKKIKTKDGRRAYDINERECTINGVPVYLTSAIKDFTSATTSEYVMAYGTADAYELAQFSSVEISKSSDYKFKEGMNAYKAVGFFGGNVVKHNGFIRAKKSV